MELVIFSSQNAIKDKISFVRKWSLYYPTINIYECGEGKAGGATAYGLSMQGHHGSPVSGNYLVL